MRRSRHLLILALACAASLAHAPSALAHAQLVGSAPESGTTVPSEPGAVIFKFNQNVGGTLGAVRVYDADGHQVDNLDVTHPHGQEHWIGVGLKPGLADGTYTATYRVISADTHIVYGGLVFNIGHAGATPKVTVAGLIARNESGEATRIAFAIVRALDYLAIALMLGGLSFVFVAWRPAFASTAEGDVEWQRAGEHFGERMRGLLLVAVALGVLVSVLGVLLQGASAAGVSLWASLKNSILQDTLESRFGEVWGLRALDWLLLGALLIAASTRRRRTGEHAPLGAGDASTAAPAWLLAAIAVCAGYLALTPALSGHADVQGPTVVFLPADVLHVLAASVWVGGIVCLLFALPAATRQLAGHQRSRLLLATLARFSPLALAAVVAIAVTGVVQAYIDVRSLHALLHSTYGALIIAKTLLLLTLICLGWVNRGRIIPAIERVVAAARSPGSTGMRARRTIRAELALMIAVLGVTAALVAYTPPIDAAAGPFSIDTTLGAAELEMTVDPAAVGVNTIHLYLIDARSGVQFTASKELTVTARLPSKGIGPLALKANLAGPGHYVLNSAVLSPAGTWDLEITDRVSEFEQHTRVVKVPIR
jgi:copper transport protein